MPHIPQSSIPPPTNHKLPILPALLRARLLPNKLQIALLNLHNMRMHRPAIDRFQKRRQRGFGTLGFAFDL